MGQELAVGQTSGAAFVADAEDGEENDWGASVHQDLLNFGSASSTPEADILLAEGSSAEERVVFQRKLAVIADSPANYLRPFAAVPKVKLDLGRKEDRVAAVTACVKLRGVSRWKPNLVPRLVSEEEFFSNLFSYILATADEHYRAAPDLKYIPNEQPVVAENPVETKREERPEMALRQTNGAEKEVEKVEVTPEGTVGDQEVLRRKDGVKESVVEPVASVRPPKSALVNNTAAEREKQSNHPRGHSTGSTNGNGTAGSTHEKQAKPPPSSDASAVVATAEPKRKAKKTVRFSIDIDNWKAQARFGTFYPAGAKTSQLKAAFSEKNVLFFIEKSQNSNCVVYVANVDEDGKLDRQNPIHPYWILYDRTPVIEEELTMAERLTAYGTTVSPIANKPGHYMLAISSVKSRPFEVWIDSSGFLHTIGQCNGKRDEILSIYVKVNFNWIGIPSVEYVDVIGREGKERLYNTG